LYHVARCKFQPRHKNRVKFREIVRRVAQIPDWRGAAAVRSSIRVWQILADLVYELYEFTPN